MTSPRIVAFMVQLYMSLSSFSRSNFSTSSILELSLSRMMPMSFIVRWCFWSTESWSTNNRNLLLVADSPSSPYNDKISTIINVRNVHCACYVLHVCCVIKKVYTKGYPKVIKTIVTLSQDGSVKVNRKWQLKSNQKCKFIEYTQVCCDIVKKIGISHEAIHMWYRYIWYLHVMWFSSCWVDLRKDRFPFVLTLTLGRIV